MGLCQGEVTLGSGYTDASGSVTINVAEVPTSDDVTLTVTAHNLYPLQEMVSAGGSGVDNFTSGVTPNFGLSVNTPITGTAAVSFTVPSAGRANLSVFDMTGRVVEPCERRTGSRPAHRQLERRCRWRYLLPQAERSRTEHSQELCGPSLEGISSIAGGRLTPAPFN